jgi:hypothetical protein
VRMKGRKRSVVVGACFTVVVVLATPTPTPPQEPSIIGTMVALEGPVVVMEEA